MHTEEFNKLIGELEYLCVETLGDRRAAYSETDDRLSNFKQISELTGVPVHSVCAVLMGKHIIALNKTLKEGYTGNPKILEYIIDILNYHKLLWGILNERNEVPAAEELGRILPSDRHGNILEQQMPESADRSNTGSRTQGSYYGIQRAAKRYAPLPGQDEVGSSVQEPIGRKGNHPQW